MLKPINRIFCKIVDQSNNDLILSNPQELLDKYSIAEIIISNHKEYKAGLRVVIPSFSDKFDYEGTTYNVIHESDIIAICE